MRSLLEKAIVHLLNEEHEQAEMLFHKFIVGRAKQLHESLRQGDDAVLDETWNDDMTEEYFTEDDLDGLEGVDDTTMDADLDAEHAEDDAADAETDAVDSEEDAAAADDLSDDLGMDDDHEDGGDVEVPEDQLDDVKAQLDDLVAKFTAIMNGDDDTVDASDLPDDDTDADENIDGDDDIDSEGGDSADGMETDSKDDDEFTEDMELMSKRSKKIEEDDDMDMDDFSDIAESIASELQKITLDATVDGKEIGDGKTIDGNKKSGLTMKEPKLGDAKPVTIKSTDHNGFEREQAPTSKMVKKARNNMPNAEGGRSTVSKLGDSKALLNKDFAK